jgi:hypothetical protein
MEKVASKGAVATALSSLRPPAKNAFLTKKNYVSFFKVNKVSFSCNKVPF